jgi:hypothetical protein
MKHHGIIIELNNGEKTQLLERAEMAVAPAIF